MSTSVLTYDPRKVVVIFGYDRITGFAEDEMVKIKPNGEGMQIYVGADGEVGRSVDPNHTFEITINLASTSKSNNTFTKAYNADRVNGSGKRSLLVKDLSGDTLFFAKEAWPSNFPEAAKGRKIANHEWVLHTGQITDPILGGTS